MSEFKDINDFKIGQVFVTKKGHKMEVTDVCKDKTEVIVNEASSKLTDKDTYDKKEMGSVELKKYVHRDSENITSTKGGEGYSWGHNTKWFKGYVRIDGKTGLLRVLQLGGWKLKK